MTPERQRQLEEGVSACGRKVRFKCVTDECERLAQVAFPEEVLIGHTLDEQAESLANWILRGFEALELLDLVRRPEG